MAYSKDVKKVYYLDSLDDYNREHANVLQRRIGIHLKGGLKINKNIVFTINI